MIEDEIRCSAGLEIREDETRASPGRLVGTLMPYGETIRHGGRGEMFEARSLQWGADGVTFYDSHDRTPRRPVAIVHPEQRDNGAFLDFPLPNNPAGRRIAAGVRGGQLKGLSVEFRSAAETRDGNGVRKISKAWLSGLAAVADPAYASATVEVRGKQRRRFWL